MSFSFEKLLSTSATVTGRVRPILRAVHKFGCIPESSLSWIKISSSSKAMVFDGKSGKFFNSCVSSLPSKSDCLLKCRVVQCCFQFCNMPIVRPRPISISAVKWSFILIFLWTMIIFMFICIFLRCRMYKYMYLCTNKDKTMTQITIRLIDPILRVSILQPVMSTNFTQNWREHCTKVHTLLCQLLKCEILEKCQHSKLLSHNFQCGKSFLNG